jgi:hypothetical protein
VLLDVSETILPDIRAVDHIPTRWNSNGFWPQRVLTFFILKNKEDAAFIVK